MHKLNLAKQLITCVIELLEYGLMYKARKAIKVQALANFVVELTQPNSKMVSDKS